MLYYIGRILSSEQRMSKIQEKLDGVLDFIRNYYDENSYSPSVREICAAMAIKSTATCQYYLDKLEERGEISRGGLKKRAITLCGNNLKRASYVSVPLIGTVTAGVPIFAYENLEEYCPLPTEFGAEDELFMLRVKGDSMINAGIFNGDKVIVRKQNSAENGNIVVAMTEEGDATVKRFYKKNGKYVLHPENDALSDIILDNVAILGLVEGLIRKF